MSKLCEALVYEPSSNRLRILNQLALPIREEYETIVDCKDAWNAIKQMKVRGGPAIAHAGLFGVVVEICEPTFLDKIGGEPKRLQEFLIAKADYLCSARPTAVNVRKEFDELNQLVAVKLSVSDDVKATIEFVRDYAIRLLEADRSINRAVGDYGAKDILKQSSNNLVNVLTHCNTGSIATAGHGTALGVIRSLHSAGRLERAYATETRPYNQGARLTAWELLTENIPSTLVCDNMVASLMNSKRIHAVVVGADRVVANGDTANKIGTFQIAILAKHFGIPFYVAAPKSAIDLTMEKGSMITIEERPHREMKFVGDTQIAPLGAHCWNPAFDVTPAEFITGGIITEFGVFKPQDLKKQFSL